MSLLRGHPLLSFFVLTFALSWGGWPLYAAGIWPIPFLVRLALSKTLIKHCQLREIGSVSSGLLGRAKVPAEPAGAGCR